MIAWALGVLTAFLLLTGATLAPQGAQGPPPPAVPSPEAIEALLALPAPVVETATAASVLVAGGCALYAGPQLDGAEVLAELHQHDWAPFSPETILELFRRESDLYLAAENLCTDDHGIPQINQPYHGSWCDVVRVKVDLRYAITCANRIFADQGISAWMAAEGWLW